jgi:long-subunit fatty acid transport protein
MYRGSIVRIIACCAFALGLQPQSAAAGGSQYPADGTWGLGRGGAIMDRADNPRIMVRNPALLADLWGSMLYMNANIGFPDVCSQLSGGYGWGEGSGGIEILRLDPDGEPIVASAPQGAVGGTDPDNLAPLQGYQYEPYPEICHQTGTVIAPSVGLTGKFGDKLGAGIGFMPPEMAMDTQFGNLDGTVETPNGLRPNPMRYMDSGRAATYFGLLGAVGYRIVPWLRVGGGFRWTMVHADVNAWNKYGTRDLSPTTDLRIHYYGNDMFVPGFTTSVHVVPIDALDIAIGFNWEDNPRFPDAKLDIETSPWGPGVPYYYRESPDAPLETYSTYTPYMNHNVPGRIKAPPVASPQLSFGIRFADRIKPRPKEYTGLIGGTDPVRDHLAEEHWDIEFDAILYLNSAFNQQHFYFKPSERITRVLVSETGEESMSGPPGTCPDEDGDGQPDNDDQGNCLTNYYMPANLGGQDQISLRLGGDYNIIPNVFAVRAGVSYEGRGADPSYARPPYGLPFERLGLHTGLTWRLDGRTDLTFAFAHFFQETIKVAVNGPDSGAETTGTGMDLYLRQARRSDFNPNAPPEGYTDEEVNAVYHIVDPDEADGVAMQRTGNNVYFVNAGTHEFSLNVVGASIARHF